MTPGSRPGEWSSDEWQANALTWIDDRLREAYLEPFGDVQGHDELRETLRAAHRVAMVSRA